ncbi:MAG: thioredoxin-like domain-containing protein [Bacteroidales bacterium]|jgi:thiol-disulfide isomerase/thioredoxin|nr:thioredoxin-like domain-containing protein [Bacteroidales bacterium]MDY0196760.1 thioredoxin-like domain-containing protein [Tenuifilaceae bacterium]
MRSLFFILIALLGISLSACSQDKQKTYRIEVNLSDLKDTTLLLGYHFGEKKFIADTAQLDSKGKAVFTGDTLLPGGMYIVVLPQRSYFDILVGDDQNFSLSTSSTNSLEELAFIGSPENTAFANYQRFMGNKQGQMNQLRTELQQNEGNIEKEKEISEKIKILDKEVNAYWDKIIKENPNTFFANIIKSLKPVEFPEFNIPENAINADSLRWVFSYQYNQRHFFDNIELTDSRFIRTPFFQSRLDTYFDKILLPLPDTIIAYGDKLINQVKGNQEMFRYIVAHLFSKYQNSAIMGMDAVFVHLAEKYYLSGEMKDVSESLKQKIAERVADLKPNLIGQIAPNITMRDSNNKFRDLHALEAKVTIMYFWEPGCSHCKKVTPELKKLNNKYKDKGVSVFAVYTQGEQEKWLEYIKTNELNWINVWDPYRSTNYHKLYDIYSTPILYILDKDKRIIAKRIGIESLERFIEEELKK